MPIDNLKASVVVTTLDEEHSISDLLNALLSQNLKPDEIIVVDGGSKDRTLEFVRHFQKKDKSIKVLKGKYSRSKGRNIGIEIAGNKIIALTDAGCIPKKNWLKRLTEPFTFTDIDISAGFYEMKVANSFSMALSMFLGIIPSRFDNSFLPSARSMAITRDIWERVGGFPESLEDTAEDSVFAARAVKLNAKFARVKDARVEWSVPETPKEAFKKIKGYAKGDVMSGIWLHPCKRFASHNIKASLILIRYIIGLILLFYLFSVSPILLIYWFIGLLIYCLWAYRKVYLVFGDGNIALWGIFIQFLSDFAVITGFIEGIFAKKKAR